MSSFCLEFCNGNSTACCKSNETNPWQNLSNTQLFFIDLILILKNIKTICFFSDSKWLDSIDELSAVQRLTVDTLQTQMDTCFNELVSYFNSLSNLNQNEVKVLFIFLLFLFVSH